MATRSLGSLTLDLIASTGGFEKGMDRAARSAQDRSRKIQRTMRNLQRTVIGAFAAIGAGAAIRSVIGSTIEAEDVFRQLEARVESTGQVAGFTAMELSAMAGDFQRVTTFGDEAIAAMQGVLLTFTQVRGDVFVDATEAILNMSVALGKDLQSSALQVGKALNDPILGVSALREAGVQLSKQQADLVRSLTETGDIAGAQRVILGELETQFGGAARAAADTFGGALTQVQNAFGDLLEAPGGMDDAKTALQDLAALLQDPATIQAANNLTTALIEGFAAATKAANVLINTIAAGYAGADPFALESEINATIEQMEELEAAFKGQNFARGRIGAEEYRRELNRLTAQLAFFKRQQEEALGVGNAGAQPLAPEAEPAAARGVGLFQTLLNAVTGSLDAVKELQAETEALTKSFDSQLAAYERQLTLTGEVTELERIRFEISRGGLAGITEAQAEQLEGLAATIDAERELQAIMDRGREITQSVITPAERLRDTYAELNDLLDAGAISYETYLRAIPLAQDALEEASQQFDTVRDQLMRNTQDIFADTLFNQFEDGLDGMFDAFRDMLLKMATQAAAARLTEKIFGSIGEGDGDATGGLAKFFAGLFGGNRATGGPVSAGRLYGINENEPEYFVPNTGGQVVPLSRMGGGNTFNFAIQAPQGTVSRETQLQVAGSVERVLRASRRNS